MSEIILAYGAMCDQLSAQLKRQGVELADEPGDPRGIEHFQRLADSLTFLRLHGYITDSERRRIEKKINAAIVARCRRGGAR